MGYVMSFGDSKDDIDNSVIAHIDYSGEEEESCGDTSGNKDSIYDVEPIGYFEFLVKHRNRIVEDSISIRLTGDQVRGVVNSLMDYTSGNGGVGVLLVLKVDNDKSSMHYQDGMAIQDFIIKVDNVVPIRDSVGSTSPSDVSGQLVFDWS